MAKSRGKKKRSGGKRKPKIVAAKPLSSMRINGGPWQHSKAQRFKVLFPDGREVWYPFDHWQIKLLIKKWKKQGSAA